jgi:2-keto-4-pentenoate hydratase
MTNEAVTRAAANIARARLNAVKFDALPVDCRPSDENAGYAIQDALHAQLAKPVTGYKIGCTTKVMQEFLNIDQPCAGQILEADCHDGPADLAHNAFRRVGVECEIAVRLGTDLPSRNRPYDREAVAPAVESCMAAIEIVDDRYVDYTKLDAPTLIADDFFGAGCVLGDPLSDWRHFDLAAVAGRMHINGHEVGQGVGAHVMGHPLEALAWLANTLARRGRSLAAGEIVLTGSIVETHWLAVGDRVEVSIDGIGTSAVTFI